MCSLWLNILVTIAVLITNISNTQSASCNSHTIQSTCEATTNCKWITTPPTLSTIQCVCASETKLDILIGVDGSGSIGEADFQIQKEFIAELVTQSISNTQRIGFTMFATTVDILSTIQLWDNYQTLQDFVMNINYLGGWTNTDELLVSAQEQFASITTPDRKKILLIITDGNPCMPAEQGGCPKPVCGRQTEIQDANIRVIIVGIGAGWNPDYVTCLTNQTANDVLSVAGYTSGDFESVFGPLSPGLCPATPTNSPTTFPSHIPSTTHTKFPSITGATIHPSTSPTKFPIHIPSSVPTKFPSIAVDPSTPCNSHTIQSNCEANSNCKWITNPPTLSTIQCVCASETELDILIGVDGSGSIGEADFQIQKEFIAELVTQSISNTQRIGFTMFATTVDILRTIQLWDNYQTLQDFVMNINYLGGWTNTDELLVSAQAQFANITTPGRKKILLIITDGNPCMPAEQGGCPKPVCQRETEIKDANIRVIIVGIGAGWNPDYVTCLTNQTANDVLSVTGFTSGDFDAIFGDLSVSLCPSLPTNSPTMFPSIITDIPSDTPSKFPSIVGATIHPSTSPTGFPSDTPSKFPSIVGATIHPSISPTKFPIHIPSSTPTKFPSSTVTPSKYPTVIPSKFPTVIPSKDPTTLSPISAAPTYTRNPTTGPTESPITNVPTRSPINYKFCTNNGDKGNDNISGKFIMIYDDDGSSDLSYEDVCEFCMCNGVDVLSICTNIAEMIKNLNDEMKNAFMDVCRFKNECTFERIGLKPVSKRINRCGCEIFECEPLGGANKAPKTPYGFGFVLTLISCFVMYYV